MPASFEMRTGSPIRTCRLSALLALAVLLAGAPARAGGDFAPISGAEARKQLTECERTVARYIRNDPANQANASIRTAASNFNAWAQAQDTAFAKQKDALEQERAEIEAQQKVVQEYDKTLAEKRANRPFATSLLDYTRLLQQRNELVGQINERVARHQQQVTDYNRAVAAFNREADERRTAANGAQTAAKEKFESFTDWIKSHGDLDLSRTVNVMAARLAQTPAAKQGADQAAAAAVAGNLRVELGAWAARRQEQNSNGLIVVEARLDGRVPARLILDTGASLVTLPSSVIVMLGLESRLGEETELSLAGGRRIKGRQVVIPSLTVFGHEVRNVEAVVADESECGIDGLLGHSFLDHFIYTIDKDAQPPVTFMPKGGRQ